MQSQVARRTSDAAAIHLRYALRWTRQYWAYLFLLVLSPFEEDWSIGALSPGGCSCAADLEQRTVSAS